MARLDDLILRLDIQNERFKAKLRQTENANQTSTRRIEGQWRTASRGIGKARAAVTALNAGLAVIATGGAALGLDSRVREFLELADSIDKVAQKLGLSAETLQEYRFAASQSGIEQRTLDLAVQRFVRRAGEAANGTGEARDALRELGIQLRDTNGEIRSTDELFSDAAESLAATQNPADRLRLAFKLFDSEGAALVNLVDDFASLREEARRAGIAIDDGLIRQAVEAKDELDVLARVTEANLAPALARLAPILVSVSDAFARVAGFAADVFDSFAEAEDLELRSLIRQAGIIGAERKRLESLLADQRERREGFAFSFEGAGNLLGFTARGLVGQNPGFLETQIQELNDQYEEYRARIEEIQQDRAALASPAPVAGVGPVDAATLGVSTKAIDALRDQAAALERLAAARRGGGEASAELLREIEIENLARKANVDLASEQGKAFAVQADRLLRLQETVAAYDETQSRVNAVLDAGRSPAQQLADQMDQLEEDFRAGRISADQLEAAMASLDAQYQRTTAKTRDAAAEFATSIDSLSNSLVSNFSDTMAEILLTGRGTFQDLAASFAQDFVSAAIRSAAIASFTNLFGGTRFFRGGAAAAVSSPLPLAVVPAIASPAVAAASVVAPGATAAPVSVSIVNQSGGEVTTTERQGPGGQRDVEVVISQAVARDIGTGGPVAKALETRLGIRPRGA